MLRTRFRPSVRSTVTRWFETDEPTIKQSLDHGTLSLFHIKHLGSPNPQNADPKVLA